MTLELLITDMEADPGLDMKLYHSLRHGHANSAMYILSVQSSLTLSMPVLRKGGLTEKKNQSHLTTYNVQFVQSHKQASNINGSHTTPTLVLDGI